MEHAIDFLLCLAARALIRFLRRLPLLWVALAGRAGGELFYWVDLRHRRVAIQNLRSCFGAEKSDAEIDAFARENFRRIGENYACAIKTSYMSPEQLRPHLRFRGLEKLMPKDCGQPPESRVFATGHFGNFELLARFGQFDPRFREVSTYRGLRHRMLDRLLHSLRARSGCQLFERRTEVNALKNALHGPGVLLGLLADQHAGHNGLQLQFLGRDCSTSAAPAVFALRYRRPLHVAICFRIAPARWVIEVSDEIATREAGERRPLAAIMEDVNRIFEAAIRRDPANWFWVHNRWKASGRTHANYALTR